MVRSPRNPTRRYERAQRGTKGTVVPDEVEEANEQAGKKPTRPPNGQGLRPRIKAFFERHRNVDVYMAQLLQEFDGAKPRQILNAIHMLRAGGMPITIVQRGQVYRYAPPNPAKSAAAQPSGDASLRIAAPSTARRTFVEVGPTRDGWYVIQSQDGALFRAEPL